MLSISLAQFLWGSRWAQLNPIWTQIKIQDSPRLMFKLPSNGRPAQGVSSCTSPTRQPTWSAFSSLLHGFFLDHARGPASGLLDLHQHCVGKDASPQLASGIFWILVAASIKQVPKIFAANVTLAIEQSSTFTHQTLLHSNSKSLSGSSFS